MMKRFFSQKYKEIEKYLNKKIIKKNYEIEENKYDHIKDDEIKKNLRFLNRERFYIRKIDQTKYITNEINPDHKSLYPITNPNEIAECIYTDQIEENSNIPYEVKNINFFLNVSIIGPSNSGKSTLMNKLLNKTISSISNKKFTTFEKTNGNYFNFENKTLINYSDYPPFDDSNYKCLSEINSYDLILLVVDIKKSISDNFFKFLKKLNESLTNSKNIPEFLLILNKADTIKDKKKINNIIKDLEGFLNFKKKFIISCETNFMVEELKQYLIDNSIEYQNHNEYQELNLIEKFKIKKSNDEKVYFNKKENIEEVEEITQQKEKSYSTNIELDINNMIKGLIFNYYQKELPYIFDFEIIKLSFFSQKTLKLTFKLRVPTKNHIGIVLNKKSNSFFKIKKELQVLIYQNLGFKADIDIFLVVKPIKKWSQYEPEKLYPTDELTSNLNEKEIKYRIKQNESTTLNKISNLLQ